MMIHMLHAFIDESYIEGRVYLVGAIVMDDAQIRALDTSFDELLWKTHKAHGIPLSAELHGQELFHRSGDWFGLSGKPNAAFAVYRNALNKLTMSGARIFIRGVDQIPNLAKYVDPHPPHAIALQHLLEQLQKYGAAKGEQISIVADRVPDQAQHEARMDAFRLNGTKGVRQSFLENIEMPFQWESSADHRGLQAIDLATFVYLRRRYHTESHPKLAFEVQRLRDAMLPAIQYHNVWSVPA